MPSSLSLLKLSTNNASTQEKIISILSETWPLSAKEIHNRLVREHGSELSYQAIHKTLCELEENYILEREGKGYKLGRSWISNMKEFVNEIDSRYSNTVGKYEIDPDFEGTIKLYFDDYSLFCVTMAKLFADQSLVGSRPEPGIGIVRHGWWPLNFNFMDFDLLRKMTKNNRMCYAIIRENAPFDRWIATQYKKAGWKIKVGIDLDELGENDLAIHGDSIIKVKFSKELNKKIDEIYMRISSLSGLYKEYIIQTFSKSPGRIDVTITKDSQLALIIQKQFMKYFEEGGNDP